MKITVLLILLSLLCSCAAAKDIHVDGYYRKDGTYVRPHVRSSPDGIVWNNYGKSECDAELMNPKLRDSDSDGIPNYLDKDE